MPTPCKKICLIGDAGVGKTSLIRSFVDRQFSDRYLSTVGVKISRKLIELSGAEQHEKLTLQLLIWDLEGHTKFKSIAPSYLGGASGAIVVGDVTRQETMERLNEHVQLFFSVNAKGFVVVALNKIDLFNEEERIKIVHSTALKEQSKVIATYQTSAKIGTCVDEIFQTLAYTMVAK